MQELFFFVSGKQALPFI